MGWGQGKGPLSIPQIEERFDGTICRCTGYRPIMTACHSFAAEGVPGEIAPATNMAGVAAATWAPHDPASEPDVPAPVAEPAAALNFPGCGDKPAWLRPLSLDEVKASYTGSEGKDVRFVSQSRLRDTASSPALNQDPVRDTGLRRHLDRCLPGRRQRDGGVRRHLGGQGARRCGPFNTGGLPLDYSSKIQG